MPENDRWRIVLIDDEEGIRRVTRITLEDAGYTVYTADNGKNGLALCEEVAPQIVITDVRMPIMDGIAVLEAVKKNFPNTEVMWPRLLVNVKIARSPKPWLRVNPTRAN